MTLGWLGRKKGDAGQGAGDGSAGGGGAAGGNGQGAGGGDKSKHNFSPDKAARFIDRAKTAQETGNYEFAMTLWLGALRQDPTNMRALEAFFQSCAYFLREDKKLSKETRKMFDGKEPVDNFLNALLTWGMEPEDAVSAVRAAEQAAKLGLVEPTFWIGDRAMGAIDREKKPRKDLFLKMVEVFGAAGIPEKAVEAATYALQLDPSDGKLAAEIRNLSAQATMAKGGYEQTGESGGFRANIRDLDKQRKLDDSERISKTEETLDRLVADAAEDYAKRPDDAAVINLYAKRLMERGRPEDEKKAIEVLRRGHEATKQFRFREMEGQLKLRIAGRRLAKRKQDAEATPASAKAAEYYRQGLAQFAQMELDELKLRMENYPTDLGLKFELGKRYFEHGDAEQAIALFQQSQEDAKNRVASLNYLGQSFMKIGWTDEAVHTFRKALEGYRNVTDEMGMELRYGLLTGLQTKAEAERDLQVAEEADKLASAIAIQLISYKDIRARRDALKKLMADLKRGDAT